MAKKVTKKKVKKAKKAKVPVIDIEPDKKAFEIIEDVIPNKFYAYGVRTTKAIEPDEPSNPSHVTTETDKDCMVCAGQARQVKMLRCSCSRVWCPYCDGKNCPSKNRIF